jgi:GcrA cell cycle regulator
MIWQGWTDDKVAELKRHFAEGLSWSQIGAKLGCSRHAVGSKIDRLKLSRTLERRVATAALSQVFKTGSGQPRLKGSEFKPGEKAVLRVSANGQVYASKTSEKEPKLRTADVEPRNVTLMERSDYGCKYPSGHDGEQHLFCDLPRADDGPYCHEHAKLCFTGAPPKKIADPSQLRTNGMAFDFRTRAA